MTEEQGKQKNNNEVFEKLKNKSKESKKRHQETSDTIKALNDNIDEVHEKK